MSQFSTMLKTIVVLVTKLETTRLHPYDKINKYILTIKNKATICVVLNNR